ncbi:hypothetical protein SLEP1_g48155 [Rubroshorea leprosula]|uniref:Uncharacterized protein n=1 Tax=Rubroshorea leprosula TaxID=152421 RepID=A0AAV5LVK9_9ROSI|nr:hypothetical protein SLEP1_g48155 [Rubroshorea leprosula]
MPSQIQYGGGPPKAEATPAPIFLLIVGISVIVLFISMPRLKDVYQANVGVSTSALATNAKREAPKPALRKKAY